MVFESIKVLEYFANARFKIFGLGFTLEDIFQVSSVLFFFWKVQNNDLISEAEDKFFDQSNMLKPKFKEIRINAVSMQ
jgi:hypothetical protein